jgi:hypothetical protein
MRQEKAGHEWTGDCLCTGHVGDERPWLDPVGGALLAAASHGPSLTVCARPSCFSIVHRPLDTGEVKMR